MRTVYGALAAYHTDRKAELENEISSEQAMVKLGSGDRTAPLRATRRSPAEREGPRAQPGGGERFQGGARALHDPSVAALSHCLAIPFQRSEPACESSRSNSTYDS